MKATTAEMRGDRQGLNPSWQKGQREYGDGRAFPTSAVLSINSLGHVEL